MARPKLLVFTAIALLLGAAAYWLWSTWGLITVHADQKPLAEVIRSISKQGGIKLRTNLDENFPVTMHVDKVPLTEALETLAAVTDSQWRLTYLFAPDRGALDAALAQIASGARRAEGWKNFELPAFGTSGESIIPSDPRDDEWEVKVPEDKTLQGWLRAAAIGVSAGFACPETYNPTLSSGPSSGEIHKRAEALAKAAGAKMEEMFFLIGRRGDSAESAEQEENPDRARRREGMGGMMRERRLAEIAKLPAGEREAAQREFDEMSAALETARNLPPEERRAKMEEFFQNSDRAERMEDRRMQREERQTPEQRHKRYQRYVDRKRSSQASQ